MTGVQTCALPIYSRQSDPAADSLEMPQVHKFWLLQGGRGAQFRAHTPEFALFWCPGVRYSAAPKCLQSLKTRASRLTCKRGVDTLLATRIVQRWGAAKQPEHFGPFCNRAARARHESQRTEQGRRQRVTSSGIAAPHTLIETAHHDSDFRSD